MEIPEVNETILNIIKRLDDNADRFDEMSVKVKELYEEVCDLKVLVSILKRLVLDKE